MEDYWFTVIAIFFTATAISGSLFNLAVIYLISRNKKLWNRQMLLILHLACADFFMATFGIIFPLISAVRRTWIFGSVMCEIYAFVMAIGGIATVCTLALLSFDRVLMVRQSTWSLWMPREHLIILYIWVYSFLVTSPPLFGWGRYAPENPGISCSVDWELSSWNSLSYIIFLFTAGFFVPVLLTFCSYVGICLIVRQKNLLRKRKLSKTAEHTENQREARVFWMITAMTICYVMAWFPYASLAITKVLAALVERTSSDPTERIVINDWSFIAALLAKLSVTFNPIIYAVFNTQLRSLWSFNGHVMGIRRSETTSLHLMSTLPTMSSLNITRTASHADLSSSPVPRSITSVCELVAIHPVPVSIARDVSDIEQFSSAV